MANLVLHNPSEPPETLKAIITAINLDEAQLALTATASSVTALTGTVTTQGNEITALQGAAALVKYVAPGAIAPAGRAVLNTGTAAAMTLVNPPADNILLIIAAQDAEAYTLTCSAGKLNGGTVGTFAGAVGSALILLSCNGVWLAISNNGVVIV